jgi:hypothetical protein
VTFGPKAFVLGAVPAGVLASCGGTGIGIQPRPTDDPFNGTDVVKGGGGAIDSVRALTTAFTKASTRTAFESYFFGSAKLVHAKDASEVFQIDETLKTLGSFKDAIAMLSMNAQSFSSRDVKLRTIDNVAATRDNLANGTYPIRRPLYFVYNTDGTKLKPAIKSFIDWVKGPDGQKVIAGL